MTTKAEGAQVVVYIVDDDASVREALSRLADAAGFDSRPCDSMEDFLRPLPDAHAACGVLDMSSPLACDPALWRRLRDRAGAMPVIALSARNDPVTLRRARELGARAFFRKPVDAAALLDSIDWFTHADG